MIKVFTVNGNGKIEFTKAELEKLLNEVYAEGQNNCNCGHITWTNPYTMPYVKCNDPITTSASTDGAPATLTIPFNSADAQEMSKRIDEIFKNAAAKMDSDAFSKLAKELNSNETAESC